MKKTIVIVYDGAVINGGAAKIAIQSAVELAKNPDINMIYFAANAEVDECLQSNDAIKVVCIDTPHIASNKNKIKASLYGIWNRKAKTEFAKLLLDLDPKHTVIHIHGWSKALSVSVVAVAQNMHFPVLITLHDYFAVCPNGGFFNYQKKELCHLEPMSWKCISCNCDKRSYFQKFGAV